MLLRGSVLLAALLSLVTRQGLADLAAILLLLGRSRGDVRHPQALARGGGDGAVDLHALHAKRTAVAVFGTYERVGEKRGQRPGAQPHAQRSRVLAFSSKGVFRVGLSVR